MSDNKHKRILVKECIENLESTDSINLLCEVFYKNLFLLEPKLKILFSENNATLNRKFFNMLVTFKGVKYLEKISEAIISMGVRHKNYGITEHFLLVTKEALMESLEEVLKADFFLYKDAWDSTFFEVSELMKLGVSIKDKSFPINRVKNIKSNFIEELGGAEAITRVHKKFYDDIFDEPWLGQFFGGKDKGALVKRQTQFMIMCFGGKSEYSGETPALAHMHMYLTKEMILLRERLLRTAILSEGIKEDLCDKWIEIDHFFGEGLIKKSVDECVLKCFGQAPAIVLKPKNYFQEEK